MLLIEYGRHRNIPQNERNCNKRTNKYEFVIVYDAYNYLRT